MPNPKQKCCSPFPCTRQMNCRQQEQSRYLMQKIISCSNIHERCICLSLCADQIPCSASGPFILRSVQVCGQAKYQNNPCHHASLQIPLTLTVSDQCGQTFYTGGLLDYPVQLRGTCCDHDTLYMDAHVSLHNPVRSENARFHGQFSIWIKVYFIKNTVVCSFPGAGCPDVPIYPPPHYPYPCP